MIIDIICFIVWGIRISIGNGNFCWVDIKYECLLNFCYVCGKIGYVDWDCLDEDDEEGEDLLVWYGEWFKVSLCKFFNKNFSWGSVEGEVEDLESGLCLLLSV